MMRLSKSDAEVLGRLLVSDLKKFIEEHQFEYQAYLNSQNMEVFNEKASDLSTKKRQRKPK